MNHTPKDAPPGYVPEVGLDVPGPSDPRFPVGTRVRVIETDRRGTVRRVGFGPGACNLLVEFDFIAGVPQGFNTYAAEALQIIEAWTQAGGAG